MAKNDFPIQSNFPSPTLHAPGDMVIHEWAHTCSWKQCGGMGVPDPYCYGKKQ